MILVVGRIDGEVEDGRVLSEAISSRRLVTVLLSGGRERSTRGSVPDGPAIVARGLRVPDHVFRKPARCDDGEQARPTRRMLIPLFSLLKSLLLEIRAPGIDHGPAITGGCRPSSEPKARSDEILSSGVVVVNKRLPFDRPTGPVTHRELAPPA